MRGAAVRQFFFHHPPQPGPAFCMQHLTPVQAVRDGDAVLLILVAVTQACRVQLLHHPPRIVVAVAHLRPSRVTVRHHPARVLRVIRESAHLRIAAVIYRQQFTGFRIRVPHQWRTGQILRVCRVVHQPHRRKADTPVGAVFRTGQCVGER